MNYEPHEIDGEYKIWETTTKQYIFTADNANHCESLCDSLNSGGGFDGETPRFFNNITIPVDNAELV